MSLVYIGKLALSAILPTSATAIASASSSLGTVSAELGADLAGAVTSAASLTASPPTLAAQISEVTALLVDLNLGVTFTTPSATFQLTAIAALIADLTPMVASLSASLALGLPLGEALGEANVQAWSFSGTSPDLGNIATTAIGNGLPDGSSSKANLRGFVFAATGGTTWTDLQTFFTPIPGSQPSPSFEHLGGLSVSAVMPPLASGVTSANLELRAELATFSARLSGALSQQAFLVANPPSLAGSITIATDLLASLNAAAGFGATAELIADINAIVTDLTNLIAEITALITALASLTTSLATAGVLAFTYDGTAEDFGPALTSALAAGWPDGTASTAPSNALVLLASGEATGAALNTLFSGL